MEQSIFGWNNRLVACVCAILSCRAFVLLPLVFVEGGSDTRWHQSMQLTGCDLTELGHKGPSVVFMVRVSVKC